MGLIRKTLFLTTPGLVRPSSKKQRTAKEANRLLAEQNALLRDGNSQPVAESVDSAPGLPDWSDLAGHDEWLDEVATKLAAELQVPETARNCQRHLKGIPIEAELISSRPELYLHIVLFRTSEMARSAESELLAEQNDAKGSLQVRTADRLLFMASVRRRDEGRFQQVVELVSEMRLPDPDQPPQPITAPEASTANEIERFAQFHAQGTLTDEEFAAAKAKVLGMDGTVKP